MYEELVRQHGLCGLVLGHDHQTCGVLVDTVYEVTKAVLDVLVGLLEIVSQAVQQGMLEVAVTGVYHQARLLVDDDDVVVFVDDVQRDGLGLDIGLARRIGEHDGDHVVGLHLIVLLHHLVVH